MASDEVSLVKSCVRGARRACGAGLFVAALAGVARANGGGGGVPEIDAGSASSALTLLTGGVLLITDRVRKGRSSR